MKLFYATFTAVATLFGLLLPQAAGAMTAAETKTITISPATGQCLRNGSTAVTAAGSYYKLWKSTEEDPQVSVSTSNNDMWIHTDEASVHYYGGATFTISVTGDYAITGYSFDFEGYTGSSNSGASRTAMTVRPADGDDVTASASETGRVAVTGLETANSSFTVVAPTTGTGNVLVTNFTVTLEKQAYSTLQPFSTTQIVDGAFAPETRWYTMCVRNAGYQASRASDSSVTLTSRDPLNEDDAALWCFVGDRETGFKIYNKAAGPLKVYAVRKASVTNGYAPVFVSEETLNSSTYEKYWYFNESATDASVKGYKGIYLAPVSNTTYGLNDYQENGQLKFWDGRGTGSTFTICPTEEVVQLVDMAHGSLTRTDGGTPTWCDVWTSTEILPSVTFRNARNNMQGNTDGVSLNISKNTDPNYTLTATNGYAIKSYSITFSNDNAAFTLTPSAGGEAVTSTAGGEATLTVENLNKETASFSVSTESASESVIKVSDFRVTLVRLTPEDGAHTVKVFNNAASSIPYRIPALAKTADGRLILVVDYRYSKSDIGYGPIDLRYKVSEDNGLTWGEEQTNLGDGDDSKSSGNQWDYAFGDPSIVADREDPNEVLVMAVSGHVGYFNSTYDNPQHVVRFRSHDGGKTWTKGDSLTYQIYNLYTNSAMGKTVGIFLTSGKIMQSRYVKVGDYYRLYIAHPFRGEKGQACFVIYSDDFGETWAVLGGQEVIASTGADESKVEELPDGSVVISSRNQSGGRVVNVFTYTDSKAAKGSWSTTATPNLMGNGQVNACNGEILIVPAKRTSDGEQVYVALQSVPMSTSRQYVGFYYKELASAKDFITGSAMAQNWQAGLRVSELTSCYSTMVLMDNGLIGFTYEESIYNGGYDIIFKSLSLDTITAGKYTLDLSFTDRSRFFNSSLSERLPEQIETGTIVGQLSSAGAFEEARAAFEENPTQEGMESIWRLYTEGLPTVPLLTNRPYRLRNFKEYSAGAVRYMTTDDATMTTTAEAKPRVDDLLEFIPSTISGQYYIYNRQRDAYVGRTGANETKVTYVQNSALAGRYVVESAISGKSTVVCKNNTGTNAALHCATDGRLVPWTTTADASLWFIEPVTEWELPMVDCELFSAAAVNLPFEYVLPTDCEAYAVVVNAEDADLADVRTRIAAGDEADEAGRRVSYVENLLLLNRNSDSSITLAIPDEPLNAALAMTNELLGVYLPVTNVSRMVDDGTKRFYHPCTFGYSEAGRAGFYPITDNTIPANAAYLRGKEDITSGYVLNYALLNVSIGAVETLSPTPSSVYDLQGRRIAQPTRGIFISGGKKLVK